FGFAVRAWSAGLDPQVAQAELLAGGAVRTRAVGRAIVGHHPLDPDAVLGEPGDRALEERDRAARVEVVEHLGVGEPRVVVDSANPSASAISAAVIRNRRNAAIAATDRCGICVGERCGRDERSTSSRSPASNRRTHFLAVTTLTPAASAAAASDQPSTNTRLAINALLFGQVLALAC